ncbi:MAG: ser/threonine protein phosphatase [Gammaproteobacteria bacterium]|jgi:Icc protein|nr:ser/threonine protein phosphatase [Gammaproteobacteria bacterium]
MQSRHKEAAMLKVIQISDCHLAEDSNFEKHAVNTERSLIKILAYIKSQDKPDLLIASGDIAEFPSAAAYRKFAAMLQTFSCPVLCVAGNHDDKKMLGSLAQNYHEIGGWQFIGLDSNGPAKQRYGGFLPTAELEFLEKKLKQSSKPAIVVLHHPPMVPHNNWLQTVKLENADELIEMLKAYPQVKAVLWGHVHFAYEMNRFAKLWLSCPSTYRQFDGKAQEFAVDKAVQSGFRRLCLDQSGEIFSKTYFFEEAL